MRYKKGKIRKNARKARKVMIGNYSLLSCVWEITLGCNFSCKHCGSRGGKNREYELDTKECIRVVNELCELGCRRINLIGGEVFIRKDFKEILRIC